MEAKSSSSTDRIVLPGPEDFVKDDDWKAHPKLPGVWMKHLILACDTAGALSCHLVRVEAGKEIGLHTHEGSCEVHQVLSGGGSCRLDGCEARYEPGVCKLIPAGETHAVHASGGDLLLLATFAPALL